jgi:IS4 transposase
MAHTAITRAEAFDPLQQKSPEYARKCWGIETEDGKQKPVSWRGFHLASYWFGHDAHDDVEAFLAWMPIMIGGTPIDDPCANWHANTTDFGLVTRLHLIRLYHNWDHETALCRYLDADPSLRDALDVESCPDQSTLYSAWHDRFTEEYRDDLRDTVEKVVSVARAHGVSVPERAFTAEQSDEEDTERSARSEQRLARRTAKDIWQTAKPLVGPVVDFDRPDETEIHDNSFLELHTFLGCREDLYAETGAGDFAEDTTRERTPTGSYHRNCIRDLSIGHQRENHRAAMTEVIARARQKGNLTGKQTTAIDITEGKRFWGKRETEELKQQIIGTKESNQEVAYQYATIQIVGNDMPVVLDSVPVVKGMARHEIVEELLKYSTEMVDIDLVLMDREFENSAVKDVCEKYGVYYLTPSRMHRDEKLTAKRLAWEDTTVHVESDAAAAGRPPRKRLWIPRANVNSDEMLPDGGIPEEDDDSGANPESEPDPSAQKRTIRRQLGEEFLGVIDDEPDEETVDWALGSKFLETAEEMAYKESYAVSDDGIRHVVFETNHPDLDVANGDSSEMAVVHQIARFTRQYANRWGIENGYKKTKSFMAETTSTDHSYRFFNFIFACLLYSLWRLVDVLVKRSLGDERAGTRIRASTFLTIAKQEFGLGPPD